MEQMETKILKRQIDEEKLALHLMKCELQYRVDHGGMGELPWLAPYCGSVREIAAFLRKLGFKIAEVEDEVNCAGETHQWVITTSGIIVYVSEDGFFAKAAHGASKRFLHKEEN